MDTQSKYCKYCSNFKIAVYGPMGSGYCTRKEFEVVYNHQLGNYERRQIVSEGEKIDQHPTGPSCSNYKPIMSEPTREWFQGIFRNEF
ncbi:MAG: hypothetical protein KAR38_01250 [Calditrichia bacterium]|nr:hypothetical protein [Calditrichia bacterium]